MKLIVKCSDASITKSKITHIHPYSHPSKGFVNNLYFGHYCFHNCEITYSETCLERTPRGEIFLSALDSCPLYTDQAYKILTSKFIFGEKSIVRFRQISALGRFYCRFFQHIKHSSDFNSEKRGENFQLCYF